MIYGSGFVDDGQNTSQALNRGDRTDVGGRSVVPAQSTPTPSLLLLRSQVVPVFPAERPPITLYLR